MGNEPLCRLRRLVEIAPCHSHPANIEPPGCLRLPVAVVHPECKPPYWRSDSRWGR
jgi:hypothetical protein